jgi:streptomycin 6-kinase
MRGGSSRLDREVRLCDCVRAWRVTVERVLQTEGAVLAFGHRGHESVVVKVIDAGGDECASGPVLDAFGGRAVVRALEHREGALLLERLLPGTSLAQALLDDDRATDVLCGVIVGMRPGPPPPRTPTVDAWSESFDRCRSGSRVCDVPAPLVEAARVTYLELCASQPATQLLHGDLHHHNVLFDVRLGWVAVDPKGVVGELAYEAGAALRNPCERPELFAAPETIRRRVDLFARNLEVDPQRLLAWAFAQAVLAALWELEDDGRLSAGAGWIALANAVHAMMPRRLRR